ncbi:MAG: TfoX/Sxy family protein [Thermoleophilaceae bacterium]|nr:TfoX/Sxy family protein [Thermoleophilaceae bacterium]
MATDSYVQYVVNEVLRLVPDLTSRAMFGGHGIYSRGTIIAVVIDDELFMKVGDANRANYEQADSHPFTYHRKDAKQATMSYWTLPEEVMTDAEQTATWAQASYEVSLATKKK